MLTVKSVNISVEKGTVKSPVTSVILDHLGVQGDAHAGPWHRQVSLLGAESIESFSRQENKNYRYGEFAENITTHGELLYKMHPLDRLVNEKIVLEVTQIGKKCHGDKCAIFRETGNCVMPREGIFARVVKGGKLSPGDSFDYLPKIFSVDIITLSDRASSGVYKDLSGELLREKLNAFFSDNRRKAGIRNILIPDDKDELTRVFEERILTKTDFIFTTGGTGIGPRDISPDVIKPLLDKEIPGIMEMIRMKYGSQMPSALLSRSVCGVKEKTLVFTLPGSPRAAGEYLAEILNVLDHATLMLHGLGH